VEICPDEQIIARYPHELSALVTIHTRDHRCSTASARETVAFPRACAAHSSMWSRSFASPAVGTIVRVLPRLDDALWDGFGPILHRRTFKPIVTRRRRPTVGDFVGTPNRNWR